jgi:AraC-like DNA-binding protein
MRRVMLYLEYEDYKRQYKESQRLYNDILAEKEKLFQMTQPQGISTDQEKVKGGSPQNSFDRYLILKEEKRIDERIEEAKAILKERDEQLRFKREELRRSKHPADMAYRMRYIDRMKIAKIATNMNYSEAQVYRIFKKIRKMIENERFYMPK